MPWNLSGDIDLEARGMSNNIHTQRINIILYGELIPCEMEIAFFRRYWRFFSASSMIKRKCGKKATYRGIEGCICKLMFPLISSAFEKLLLIDITRWSFCSKERLQTLSPSILGCVDIDLFGYGSKTNLRTRERVALDMLTWLSLRLSQIHIFYFHLCVCFL